MRYLRFIPAVFFLCSFGIASGQDLVDSPHDLSSLSANPFADAVYTDSGGTSTDQLCVFCHTPHAATGTNAYGPLWNRNYSPGVFTTYSSSTFDGGAITLGAETYSCMSCHDGSVALDNLVNYPGRGTQTWSAGGVYDFVDPAGKLDADNKLTGGMAALDTDLSDDHPVGFDYGTAESIDAEIKAIPGWAPLYGGQMECATCHEVHDWDGGGPGVNGGYTMFLRQTTSQSTICTDCHDK